MSEYIFSMDKPKDCYDCKLKKENDEKNGFYDCVLTEKACALGHVSIYCPLIEVPTHGDLVNRKDVLDAMNEEIVPKGVFLSDIYKALDVVPIVIEASTEERE